MNMNNKEINSCYFIAVDDMTCQHCVKAVKKAALSVKGVTQATVSLSQGVVEVVGGLPHEVIATIKQAGYQAKPQPQIPESCPVNDLDTKVADTGTRQQPNKAEPAKQPVEPPAENSYQILIEDMTCTSCVGTVEKAILAVTGVTQAQVNLVEKKAFVVGGEPQIVVNAIIDQGYDASIKAEVILEDRLTLSFIEEALNETNEQEKLSVFLNELQAKNLCSELEFLWPKATLKTHLHPASLLAQLQYAGFQASYDEQFEDPHLAQADAARREIRLSWQRALVAGFVGVFLMGGEMGGFFPRLRIEGGQFFWGFMALSCLLVMWFSGRNYYKTALKQAKHLSANMDTLVALGTSAAWLSSLIIIIDPDFIPGDGNHLYLDASVFILCFLQFGHALETKAKRVTSEAIGALVQLAPKSAIILWQEKNRDEAIEILLPVSLLRIGDRIRIKPGETIAIDGEVLSGQSNVNESMITGESLSIAKQVGDEVIAGTGNQNGSLLVKVTRLGEDTTLANIIQMVQQAQMSKPPIANLVDKVSAVFVPIVMLISIISFFSWYVFGPMPQMAYAFTAAIAVLVIACPCALGLATPIAIMMGTGRAAQLGILIRNSDALQSAAHLSHIVMDKTGTLTEGKPSISKVYVINSLDEQQLLQLALSLELGSEHPLADAVIKDTQERNIQALDCDDFTAITGQGITAIIDNKSYFLGNDKLLASQAVNINQQWQQIASDEANQGGTPIWLSNSEELLGLLILKDKIREETADAINNLHQLGIKVVMCTGDHRDTAGSVGKTLGIDSIHSELLPEQKLEIISQLQAQGFKVGMVGDGINDAPALAKADTGFAIGSGTDVAIEHADITLVGDSLNSVSTAIAISTATIKNIKQNLLGAFIYNIIGIPLAAGVFFSVTGWLLNPMFASFAMAMSSVTVVTNANRLRFFKVKH
ncbi:MAG: heavy metal translocating P-type ATPase [Pseudomonadota bacterium]